VGRLISATTAPMPAHKAGCTVTLISTSMRAQPPASDQAAARPAMCSSRPIAVSSIAAALTRRRIESQGLLAEAWSSSASTGSALAGASPESARPAVPPGPARSARRARGHNTSRANSASASGTSPTK